MAEISLSNVSSGGGSTSPGGANTNVQYNDSGSFGGDALFVFDEYTTRLGVGVTTPDTTLNIEGPDQCVARFKSTGVGGGIDLKDQSTTANNYVGVGALGDDLCFRSGGAVAGKMRLFASGNLVVGSSLTDNGFQVETEDRDASFNGVRVGRGAGNVLTNTAVGASSLISNTTGVENTVNGYFALNLNQDGSYNTSFGGQSLQNNISGSNNTAIGRYALRLNTASNNTAIGMEAGSLNVSGTGLSAIGYQALRSSTGNDQTALGHQALTLSTGNNNTAIGSGAASGLVIGNGNVVIGQGAATNMNNSSLNVVIGSSVVFASTALSSNVVIGNASVNNGTGANNTTIGSQATNATFSGCIILGRQAASTGNNQFVVGSAAVNAGAVTPGVLAQTHSWRVKINGTDYNILLNL